MFSLLSEANRLFSSQVSFYEVAAEANMVYLTTVANLPDELQLEAFISSFRSNDNLELSIKSYLDFIYNSSNPDLWKSEYNKFLNSSEPEDEVEITIHINKRFDDRDSVIFKWRFFAHSYKELKKNYEELLDSEDLARAFDNDKAINYVKGKIIFASSLVAAIWMIFLVAVVLLCI